MTERLLIISTTDVASDARITRQIEFLQDDYDLVLAAFGPPADPIEIEFIELPPAPAAARAAQVERVGLRMLGRYERAYWLDDRLREWQQRLLKALPLDGIIVNDLYTLPLARSLGEGIPIVFDAREHWTSESASWSWRRRLSMHNAHEWLVDDFVPGVAGLVTVSAGIARDFEQRTGIHAELVTNAPYFQDLAPSEVSEPIRLIHMGVADERRRLEATIEAVQTLGDRFKLDLVLVRDNDYRRRIAALVEPISNIRLLPPVPVSEILAFANAYDIGVHLFPAVTPNQVFSLPNKFFDYVQARLAIAIGPSPEMAAVVREWNCGIVAESFEPDAFARALASVTRETVAEMKRNADRAARALTAERNRETMRAVVERALAQGVRR